MFRIERKIVSVGALLMTQVLSVNVARQRMLDRSPPVLFSFLEPASNVKLCFCSLSLGLVGANTYGQ
jgi:hypothetical protein